MNKIKIGTAPLAIIAFALLFTPMNDGAVGYVLAAISGVALLGTMYSVQQDQLIGQKSIETQNIIQEEQFDQWMQQQQKTIEEIQETGKILMQQQETFQEWQTLHVNQMTQLQERFEKSSFENQKAQKEYVKQVQEQLAQHSEMTAEHVTQTQTELQEQMDRSRQTVEGLGLKLEERWKSTEQKVWEPLLDELYAFHKEMRNQLEELKEAEQVNSRQTKGVIENHAEDLIELIEEKYDEVGNYTIQLGKSVDELEKLTQILDKRYLPLIDGMTDSAEALSETTEYLSRSIEEIASTKMQERQEVFSQQKKLLQQLSEK